MLMYCMCVCTAVPARLLRGRISECAKLAETETAKSPQENDTQNKNRLSGKGKKTTKHLTHDSTFRWCAATYRLIGTPHHQIEGLLYWSRTRRSVNNDGNNDQWHKTATPTNNDDNGNDNDNNQDQHQQQQQRPQQSGETATAATTIAVAPVVLDQVWMAHGAVTKMKKSREQENGMSTVQEAT